MRRHAALLVLLSCAGSGANFEPSYADLPSGRVRVAEENASYTLEAGSHKIVNWCQSHPGELRVRAVFAYVLGNGRCGDGNATVLDIGANFGYYGIWTSKLGCKTYLFDPQPTCHAMLRAAIRNNNLHEDRCVLVPHAVSFPPKTLPVSAATHCYGQFPMNQLDYMRPKNFSMRTLVDAFYSGSYCGRLPASFVRERTVDICEVEGLRDAHVTLAKIDTEGNELSVLQSLQTHYAAGRVGNIVVEVTRPHWKSIGISLARGFAQMRTLIDAGYAAVTLHPDDMRVIQNVREMRDYIFRPYDRSDQTDIWFSSEFSPPQMCNALRAFGACRVGNVTELRETTST